MHASLEDSDQEDEESEVIKEMKSAFKEEVKQLDTINPND